jgi:hypothetical protein
VADPDDSPDGPKGHATLQYGQDGGIDGGDQSIAGKNREGDQVKNVGRVLEFAILGVITANQPCTSGNFYDAGDIQECAQGQRLSMRETKNQAGGEGGQKISRPVDDFGEQENGEKKTTRKPQRGETCAKKGYFV